MMRTLVNSIGHTKAEPTGMGHTNERQAAMEYLRLSSMEKRLAGNGTPLSLPKNG
jgi:hypothetical protein